MALNKDDSNIISLKDLKKQEPEQKTEEKNISTDTEDGFADGFADGFDDRFHDRSDGGFGDEYEDDEESDDEIDGDEYEKDEESDDEYEEDEESDDEYEEDEESDDEYEEDGGSDDEFEDDKDHPDGESEDEESDDEFEEDDEETGFGARTFPGILGLKSPLNVGRKKKPKEDLTDPSLEEILEEVERDSAQMKKEAGSAEAPVKKPAKKRTKKTPERADRSGEKQKSGRENKNGRIREQSRQQESAGKNRIQAVRKAEEEEDFKGNLFYTLRGIRLPKLGDFFGGVDKRKRGILLILCAVLIIGGAGWLLYTTTYSSYSVADTISISGSVNCSYEEFRSGILKYSQDGAAYLTQNGTEEWNYAYQFSNPFVEINDKTGVIADKQGNNIIIFQKSGVIGEVETTLPIEKVSVSEQGIVCAILENDNAAMVMCYDREGNILVEHKTSAQGTGYPMDVALSDDGQNLMVTYLYTIEGSVSTKVIFYNFGDAGANKTDHQMAEMQYDQTLTACGFYMDGDVAVAVGDNQLVYYKGTDSPKETKVVKIKKKIESICYNRKYIGLILDGGSGYEARMYDSEGKEVTSVNLKACYSNVKLSDGKIIMYEGKKCSIIQKNGIEKFHGTMDMSILEMIPVIGINRYLIIDEDGIEKIRLTK